MEEYVKKQIDLHKRIAINYEKRYSHGYAQLFQNYWNDTIIHMISTENNAGKNVLELGCGTGTFIKELTEKFDKVYGIDISIDMLKRVDEKSGKFKGAVVGDAMKSPFQNESFDIIVCRGVLHHLPELNGSLIELNRILRKGGILIFSEPSNDSFIVRTARKIMYKRSDKFSEDDVAFLSRDLFTAIRNSGFELAEAKRFGFFSYVFAGFPDHFALLAKVPGNEAITRTLISMDQILSHIPLINRQSLHIIMAVRKVKPL